MFIVRPFSTIILTSIFLLIYSCGSKDASLSNDHFSVLIEHSPEEFFIPFEVQFEAITTVLREETDLNTIIFTWDFGDGNRATGERVSHVYNEIGFFEVQLTAEEMSGEEVQTAIVEVVGLAPADLRITTPAISPTILQTGDFLRVSLDLVNDGAVISSAHPFYLRYYVALPGMLDRNDPPNAEDMALRVLAGEIFAIHDRVLPSFNEGEQSNIDERQIELPSDLVSGEYEVFVFVDAEDQIGELDESNNIAFSTLPILYNNDGF